MAWVCFAPVVFCRYVATAHYVAAELKKHFPKVMVDVVTGELSPEERRSKIEDMAEGADTNGGRVLVATDCLSEGTPAKPSVCSRTTKSASSASTELSGWCWRHGIGWKWEVLHELIASHRSEVEADFT